MPRKQTREELERKIRSLEPYQYLVWLLFKGDKPLRFELEEEHRLVLDVYGIAKPHGGIVVFIDENGQGHDAHFAMDVESRLVQTFYGKDLVRRMIRARDKAIEEAKS